MTDLQILSAIKNNGNSIEFTSLMNLSLSDPEIDLQLTKSKIAKLKDKGYVKGNLDAYSSINLTESGNLYLEHLKNCAANETEDKRQKAFDKKTAVISLAIGVIFSDPFGDFIKWIVKQVC